MTRTVNDLSTRIQAKAFTTGTDIFFGRGEFRPATRAGQELLAHELAHVMQQAGATRTGGGAGGDGGPATSAPSSPRVLRKFDGALGKMSMSEVMEHLRATYQKVPVQWKVEQLLTLTDSSNTPVTFNTIKEIGDHFHLAALDTTSTATMAGSGLPQAVVTSGGATAMVAGGVAPTKVRALPSIPPSTTQPQAGRTQGLPSMITPR